MITYNYQPLYSSNPPPPKVYVSVLAAFNEDGIMIPRIIKWEDGTNYRIDRVSQICQAPSLKGGGQGDRYTILVNGKQSYLWFERSNSLSGNCIGKWFVERKGD